MAQSNRRAGLVPLLAARPAGPVGIDLALGEQLLVRQRRPGRAGRGHHSFTYTSSFHGDRYSRLSIAFASSSAKRCAFGSHVRALPNRKAIAPMWQTITELAPISAWQ